MSNDGALILIMANNKFWIFHILSILLVEYSVRIGQHPNLRRLRSFSTSFPGPMLRTSKQPDYVQIFPDIKSYDDLLPIFYINTGIAGALVYHF